MILYHGSWGEASAPDLTHSRSNVDFGAGFYTTPIYDQAEKWCGRFKRRGKPSIISKYEFNETMAKTLKVKEFDSYSEEWLDFILDCRSERDTTDYARPQSISGNKTHLSGAGFSAPTLPA